MESQQPRAGLEYQREYREANQAMLRAKQLQRYRDASPQTKFSQRLRRYGVDEARYAQMWTRQRGLCGGCQKPLENAHIDHDHRCCPGQNTSCGSCVRGLLCQNCNSALGMMRDDPDALRHLAGYLDSYPLQPKQQMSLELEA